MATQRGHAAGCVALWVLAAAVVLTGGQAPPPTPADPLLMLDAPWPDPAAIGARRVEAESRPLFASSETLTVTMTADFETVDKGRDPDSTRRYLGTIAVAAAGGVPGSPIPVRQRTLRKNRLDPRVGDDLCGRC